MYRNRRIRVLAFVALPATAIVVPQGANGSDRATLERAKQQLLQVEDDEVLLSREYRMRIVY